MSIREQILSLFEKLDTSERLPLLEEIQSRCTKDAINEKDAPVISCLHCDSKLFVRNDKRGNIQKYKCKSCCKIFTSRTETPYCKIKKLDKFEAYKALMFEGYMPIKKIASRVVS